MFRNNTKDTKELILKIAMQVFAKYGFQKPQLMIVPTLHSDQKVQFTIISK